MPGHIPFLLTLSSMSFFLRTDNPGDARARCLNFLVLQAFLIRRIPYHTVPQDLTVIYQANSDLCELARRVFRSTPLVASRLLDRLQALLASARLLITEVDDPAVAGEVIGRLHLRLIARHERGMVRVRCRDRLQPS